MARSSGSLPALVVNLNVGIAQIVDLDGIEGAWDGAVLEHVRTGSLDAVLCNPHSGEPIAAIQLDAMEPDDVKRQGAQLTDQICSAIGLDLFRLQLDPSNSKTYTDLCQTLAQEVESRLSYGAVLLVN